MILKYKLSKLAIKDIDAIWIYTAEQWSLEQANIYYRLIFDAVNLICANPKIGKSIEAIKKEHRSKIVKSHMIIYKIEDSTVLIDRVLHQRMDIEYSL